jgi:ATP-dependent Clp protease ATP-binding subunit ClpA
LPSVGRAVIDAAEAKYRGEIEEPLKSVLQDMKASARAIMLFIDAMHGLIGGLLHRFGSDSKRSA